MMGHIFISTTITDTKKKMSILLCNETLDTPSSKLKHESLVNHCHITLHHKFFFYSRLQDGSTTFGLFIITISLSA